MDQEHSDDRGKKRHKGRRIKAFFIILVCILAAFALGLHIYASDSYPASDDAISALQPTDTVKTEILENGDALFLPEEPYAAFVFYPGGKVEADAYAPLLSRLASKGVACVLTKMPENLAVLEPWAADRSRSELEEALEEAGHADASSLSWLIGGHSLGGAMAGSYVAGHEESCQGLVLLAAYETEDISESSLKVLLISGTNDSVLNREKYEEALANLPESYEELSIPGGIHSYFGSYGMQDGDGDPGITREEQLDITASAIASFAASLT